MPKVTLGLLSFSLLLFLLFFLLPFLPFPLCPCAACKVMVHSSCIRQLYYEGYFCKETFREIKKKVKEVSTHMHSHTLNHTLSLTRMHTDAERERGEGERGERKRFVVNSVMNLLFAWLVVCGVVCDVCKKEVKNKSYCFYIPVPPFSFFLSVYYYFPHNLHLLSPRPPTLLPLLYSLSIFWLQTVTYHHFMHRRKAGGKCQTCERGFGNWKKFTGRVSWTTIMYLNQHI